MMIAHISMPADAPEKVARVLSEIMEGKALPFPPGGPEAWMAWSKNSDIDFEVTPRGAYMLWGEEEAVWARRAGERACECHAALCVDRPAAEVLDIAERAGWRSRICRRGGVFSVVEVWVENAFLIEVLDPAFTAEYKNAMTAENWERHFTPAAA